MRVVVNNGHGRYQKGKRSPELPFDHPLKDRIMREDGQKKFVLPEWWTNREIVRHICSAKFPDEIEVINLLPNSEKYGQYLNERVKMANALKPDLYVAVHSDAFGETFTHAEGFSTFYSGNKDLANVFNTNMVHMFPEKKNRGVIKNPSNVSPVKFWELHGTNCPSVLTENFFFTNELECRLILDHIESIAHAHVNAIIEWYLASLEA